MSIDTTPGQRHAALATGIANLENLIEELVPSNVAHYAVEGLKRNLITLKRELAERPTRVVGAHGTWTFAGHWENDRIVVEHIVPGEVEDDREDTGYWEQGLFAASASGTSQADAFDKVLDEYEAPLHPGEEV